MIFSRDPTERGDQIAFLMRREYEANKPLRWWQRRKEPEFGGVADSLMLGLARVCEQANEEASHQPLWSNGGKSIPGPAWQQKRELRP